MSLSVDDVIRKRNIQQLLHFTTSNGLVGIMRSEQLLAHSELPRNKQLSHIVQINCPDRSRDRDWHSFVNLSIDRVNASFFSIARDKWHIAKDVYWCVLAFDPAIMRHDGVHFATTNNAYVETVKRSTGGEGLEALFSESVQVYPNRKAFRNSATPCNYTTCAQAEVLYPRAVSIEHLRAIYVPSEEIYHEVDAQINFFESSFLENFNIVIDPGQFK